MVVVDPHTRRSGSDAPVPASPDSSIAGFLEGEVSDAPAPVPMVPPPAPPAQPVTVSVTGTGTGQVTSSPTGLTCGPYEVTCTGWFAEGATVTLTATPDAGQVFVGWTGACTGTGPCVVAIVGPQTVGALFGAPVEFYHLDVLGSVRMITNSAGAVVTRRDYLAFGEENELVTQDHRGFTGKELDAETALQYFGARYYRSETGRFTTIDPGQASGSPEDPQGWNAYAYARNNPLRFIDPTGLAYIFTFDGGEIPIAIYDNELATFLRQHRLRLNRGVVEYLTTTAGWVRVGDYRWISDFDLMIGNAGKMAKPMADIGTAFLEAVEMGISVTFPWTSFAARALVGGAASTGNQVSLAAALSPKAARKLGALAPMASRVLGEVIKIRGGGGQQVQAVATHLQGKTLGEVAELAVGGNAEAVKAIKIAKDAARLAQKGGG